MVDRALIERKLLHLEQTVEGLRAYQSISVQEVVRTRERTWAIQHGLQIAIQIVLDIGNHLLASLGSNSVDDYAAIFDGLSSAGVLPADFAVRIRPMASVRNLLVHQYAEIDLVKIMEMVTHHLDDFATFAKHVDSFLSRPR